MTQNIFVLALDDFYLGYLRGIHQADQYSFHGLLEYHDLVRAPRYPMGELLDRAEKQLENFSGSIDGLIAYWDFPTSTMAPFLRRRFGLPGPTVESVLRCEHKYWSRLVQKEIIPDMVPDFSSLDPFADNPLEQIDLPFPFWLKPVRAHSSHLGFRIEDENDLQNALPIIRSKLRRFAEPFNVLLGKAELPPEVMAVDGYKCLAEGIICADRQCTLEGYVYGGQPRIYGIVDSLRNGHHSSLSRYQYPSTLPGELQSRMIHAAQKVMRHIGFDDGPFNIEFLYAEKTDHVSVLEINARISKSHCPLFEMVEGSSHHEVAVNLAVGQEPRYPHGAGRFACAAKFMLRRFEDAEVLSVPSEDQIRQMKEDMPEVRLQVYVEPGERLSDLHDQDSYSYEYAVLFVGGRDSAEIEQKYERCNELLGFEFSSKTP